MPSTRLEHLIVSSAGEFAQYLVNALKDATVQDMAELQLKPAPRRPDRLRSHERTEGPDMGDPSVRQPAQRFTRPAATESSRRPRKKRTNYPKCAYPGCERNRFPRGKGYCGEHWRKWQAGEIEGAEEYRGDPLEQFTGD